ncbi:YbaB/EbfC family nucleoid-associated protein [Actinophytocola sp. NPDC049390]|uniref:YbaB/EbfC family nucleoid-associated protein n=1 Tax=Actinophytocola sp. NPDC049390 TaxID=3363894 RepID=UPI003796E0CC
MSAHRPDMAGDLAWLTAAPAPSIGGPSEGGDEVESARWLASYEEMLARTAANAAAVRAAVRATAGQATSPGGEVTVTVRGGGAFDGVTLTPAAGALRPEQLARLIVATAGEAQRAAGGRVAAIMADYLGHGPALEHVTRHLPPGPPR